MSSIFQSKKRKIFGKDNLVRIEASGTWIFFFFKCDCINSTHRFSAFTEDMQNG